MFPKVLREMARVSAMGKVCCVLQADYAAIVKEAACVVLRLERVALRERIYLLSSTSVTSRTGSPGTRSAPAVATVPARAPTCSWRACLRARSGGRGVYYSRAHNVFEEMKGQ